MAQGTADYSDTQTPYERKRWRAEERRGYWDSWWGEKKKEGLKLMEKEVEDQLSHTATRQHKIRHKKATKQEAAQAIA